MIVFYLTDFIWNKGSRKNADALELDCGARGRVGGGGGWESGVKLCPEAGPQAWLPVTEPRGRGCGPCLTYRWVDCQPCLPGGLLKAGTATCGFWLGLVVWKHMVYRAPWEDG